MTDKEVLAALRRIATIAHYYRDEKLNSNEIYQAFDGIMDEAHEAIETLTTVKEQAQWPKYYAKTATRRSLSSGSDWATLRA